MPNFFDDNPDLHFYFDKGVNWSELARLTEYNWRAEDGFKDVAEALEFYRDIAELVGAFAANDIAPKGAAIDREGIQLVDGEVVQGPTFEAILQGLGQLELHAMCAPRELGGMNAPFLLSLVVTELLARADVSVMAHNSFHGGIALAMLMYSILEGSTEFTTDPARITKTRFADEMAEIFAGKAWGSMDITEPDAGSDMGALRCSAVQDDDGNWSVSGSKIFITSGHGKYHFVIARTEAAVGDDPMAGLQGLSLFLVRAYEDGPDGSRIRDRVTIGGIEEKMGGHGSATCTLNFDNAPGELVGERGQGFRLMLLLMNNARIMVGAECIGLCEAAYRQAKSYAAERRSMGKTIDRHEIIAEYLETMELDIAALRALTMHAAYHEEMSHKLRILGRFDQKLSGVDPKVAEQQRKDHEEKSRALTPLLKFLGGEKAVEIARKSIQIHGGMGYIQETGVERLLRDAMVFPIYEGTSQIQALMATKDALLGIAKAPKAYFGRALLSLGRSYFAGDKLSRKTASLRRRSTRAELLLLTRVVRKKLRGVPMGKWTKTLAGGWDTKQDFAPALLHAERLSTMLVDAAICEIFEAQAAAHPERRHLLERYLEKARPRSRFLFNEIKRTGARLLKDLAKREAELADESTAQPRNTDSADKPEPLRKTA